MMQFKQLVSVPLGILMFFSATLSIAQSGHSFILDTVICPGQSVAFAVGGGDRYGWSPSDGLSCTQCPDPVATPSVGTVYSVDIIRSGDTTRQLFRVGVYGLEAGPDPMLCAQTPITLNPGGQVFAGATYLWSGFPPLLSCTDCPSPQLPGLGTGLYVYTVALTAPGCSFRDTIRVSVVGGNPPAYAIRRDTGICLGDTVHLGGPAFPGTTYEWTDDQGSIIGATADPMVAPIQTTTYYLSASGGSCPVPARDSITISVKQRPVLQLLSDTLVCQGTTLRLQDAPPQPGTLFRWSPALDVSDSTATNPVAVPESNVVYSVVAVNGGCSVRDSVVVQVIPIALGLSADTVQLCAGGQAAVQVIQRIPADGPVFWAPLQDASISPDGLSAVFSPPFSRSYTATISRPGCQRSTSVWVQVDSLPLALGIMPQDTTVCQGELVVLTSPPFQPADFPGIAFKWMPSAYQESPDSLFNLVVKPDDTIQYIRINRVGACVDTSRVTVHVIPTVSMEILPRDTAVCPGQQVAFSLVSDPRITDITWEPASILNCSTCPNPVATIGGTTLVTAKGDNAGCPVTASALVRAFAPPAYAFPADTKLCLGDTLLLNSLDDPQTRYTWTSNVQGFGVDTTATPRWVPTQPSAVFFLDAVSPDNCRLRDTLVVTYASATLEVQGDTTICQGGTAVLRALTSLPGAFSWAPTGRTTPTISVSPVVTTTYTVTYTYAGDCRLSGLAVVRVEPSAEVVFPSRRTICPGGSIVLNENPKPGVQYTWSAQPPGFTSSLAAPAVSPAVQTTYTVVTQFGACSETKSITITPLAASVMARPDTSVCAGETVSLSASSTGTPGGVFTWQPGGQTGATLIVAPDTTVRYEVQYAYGPDLDCLASDTVRVQVSPGFDLGIGSVPDTNRIGLGQTLSLTAVVKPSQNLSGFVFNWSLIIPEQAPIGSGEQIEYKPSLNQDSTILIGLVAVSPTGCEQRAVRSYTVVQPTVVFPNAFTPGNGDDLNNTFKPVVLEGVIFIDRMDVYNRWGQRVFGSADPNAVWDGTADGKPAPADVYVYYIQYRRGDGALLVAHGDVTLLR